MQSKQVFSCEFCEKLYNTVFKEGLEVILSEKFKDINKTIFNAEAYSEPYRNLRRSFLRK